MLKVPPENDKKLVSPLEKFERFPQQMFSGQEGLA